jgi:hypothetical protein
MICRYIDEGVAVGSGMGLFLAEDSATTVKKSGEYDLVWLNV